MNVEVSKVEPKQIWKNFVLLNEVPRPSKKEEKVSGIHLWHGTPHHRVCPLAAHRHLVLLPRGASEK